MIDSNEEAIKSCNSVGEIRRVAAQNSLCEELLDSIEPVKVLLTKITERLQLKDKKFKVIQSASRELLAKVWSCLNQRDPDFNLSYTDKISVKVLTPNFKKFLNHCCCQRHYFFEVRKCGNAT